MQLLVLLCCLSAVALGAPASDPRRMVRRKLLETQGQLRAFLSVERLQRDATGDVSAPEPPMLNVEPGCCLSALDCFQENLQNLSANHRTTERTRLLSSLRNPKTREAVRCGSPAGGAAAGCRSCASFPRTAVQLGRHLEVFLQRAQSCLSALGSGGRR